MLAPALYILFIFLGLSLVMGALVAVHDGIEHLVARRAAQRSVRGGWSGGGGQRPAPQWSGYGAPARRAPRQLPVVVASTRREVPAWYESASRDVRAREVATRGPAPR